MKSLLLSLTLALGSCAAPTGQTTTTPAQAGPTRVIPTTSTPRPATSSTTVDITSTTSRAPLAGRVVVLDPGHNGMNWAHPDEINRQVDIGTGTKACNTAGTSTADGYAEPTFTWEVAQRTIPLLEELGAEVLLTRPDNDGWGPCITERAAIGNDADADAVVSIHADGGPADGRGFHVIYPETVVGLTDDIADESRRLAEALHASYRATGMPIADYVGDGGFSVRDDLGGLTLSHVPVVFLEAGNMRNPEDASLLEGPEFQDEIARAIAEAVLEFVTSAPRP